MKDSQQIWLESLPPEVRAEAEAEIALYDSPDVEESIDINDDWKPPAESGMGLTVEFSGEEIKTLTRAFGRVLWRCLRSCTMRCWSGREGIIAERGESERDSVAAGLSGGAV